MLLHSIPVEMDAASAPGVHDVLDHDRDHADVQLECLLIERDRVHLDGHAIDLSKLRAEDLHTIAAIRAMSLSLGIGRLPPPHVHLLAERQVNGVPVVVMVSAQGALAMARS